ncbi:retinaldehyde-binding protein 1 [Thecamonas trahens ATCC 50062]|uniref:Retinaldehyde-binding protein 1 n=1 Tax=Thecamonas trahens ATCC 50062 TaxID=461836 RepID=A0A0L0DCN1_THETB|nr:retinaldehyde-binding protein 1 [Thecamonas trahens ATCC 50062]KNC50077.1 retinaldehyde-binding protein 1 [Thecamonas trahens ATCC 50062]|eukprot:XP_013757241.1 retinaldehyde-binding protein 1 [Thecamonas trahens ATCC 50062]
MAGASSSPYDASVLADIACRELGELDPRQIAEAQVALARALGLDEKTLGRGERERLLRFLRARKFRLDDAAQLWTAYDAFAAEFDFPGSYTRGDLPWLTRVYEAGVVVNVPIPLPGNGTYLTAMVLGGVDKARVQIVDVHRTLWLAYDRILTNNDAAQIRGVSALQHMADAPGMGSFSRADMKRGTRMIQHTLPMRFKGMMFLHPPWYFNLMFKLVRPFLTKKMVDRINVLGSSENDLFAAIPRSALPACLGGSLPLFSPREELAAIYASLGVPYHELLVRESIATAVPAKGWLARRELVLDLPEPGMVTVTAVAGDSICAAPPPAGLGLAVGDVISAINGKRVRALSDVYFKFAGGRIVLTLERRAVEPYQRMMRIPGIDIPWSELSAGTIDELAITPDTGNGSNSGHGSDSSHGSNSSDGSWWSDSDSDVFYDAPSSAHWLDDETPPRRRRRRRRRR